MQTLKFPELTAEHLESIVRRHGIAANAYTRLPQIGVINAIYALGEDHILRVPREGAGARAQFHNEISAAPFARAVGIRTPRLIAHADGDGALPPYTLWDRVHGRILGLLDWEPAALAPVWRALERDLAHLHTARPPAGWRHEGAGDDPRASAEARAADGWFTVLEVRWLTRWLDRLAPALAAPIAPAPLHLDVQATNIMVATEGWEYRALLDWGCAGLGDPAQDFFGLPLRAISEVLAGHRAVAPLPDDANAEARILWRQLQLALASLPRGAAPGMAWGERPLAWLLEIVRFFADEPGGHWRELRP